ncbi:hypothetical protein [Amycolatopsis silviterrae]|uniref:Mce-associated membrane protein n=1 Tax=Amycolatopsis silviterrae TaxID=1656914 RepID=A0ABW5HKV7_9PSEU
MTENKTRSAVRTMDRKPSPHPRDVDLDEADEPSDGPVSEKDAESPEEEDDVAEPDAGDRPRKWYERLPLAALVVAALIVGLGAADIVLFNRANDTAATDQARADATKAAQQAVPAVLSYNPGSLDGYASEAKSKTTGEFQAALGSLIEQSVLPAAKQQQISTKAQVTASSVVSAESGKVVLLMYVNQTTTSTKLAQPALEGSRLRVTMQRPGDVWLISHLDPV